MDIEELERLIRPATGSATCSFWPAATAGRRSMPSMTSSSGRPDAAIFGTGT